MKYTFAFLLGVAAFFFFVVGPFVAEFVQGLQKIFAAFGG